MKRKKKTDSGIQRVFSCFVFFFNFTKSTDGIEGASIFCWGLNLDPYDQAKPISTQKVKTQRDRNHKRNFLKGLGGHMHRPNM